MVRVDGYWRSLPTESCLISSSACSSSRSGIRFATTFSSTELSMRSAEPLKRPWLQRNTRFKRTAARLLRRKEYGGSNHVINYDSHPSTLPTRVRPTTPVLSGLIMIKEAGFRAHADQTLAKQLARATPPASGDITTGFTRLRRQEHHAIGLAYRLSTCAGRKPYRPQCRSYRSCGPHPWLQTFWQHPVEMDNAERSGDLSRVAIVRDDSRHTVGYARRAATEQELRPDCR